MDRLRADGTSEKWFLHVNYWDVHVPYQVPDSDIMEFDDESAKEWMTQERFDQYREMPGLRSFRDTFYTRRPAYIDTRLQMKEISTPADYRKMINSYDASVAYVDAHVGMLLSMLDELGIADETAVLIMADHGEDLGERGVIGHGMASYQTAHVPAVLKWPSVAGKARGVRDPTYHYHLDLAATLLEAAGVPVPTTWDAVAVGGEEREYLVLNNFAQGNQRSVLFRSPQGGDLYYTRELLRYLPLSGGREPVRPGCRSVYSA